MNRNKKIVIVISVIIFVLTIILSRNLLCKDNLESFFIIKQYGLAKPNMNQSGCRKGAKANMHQIDQHCAFKYTIDKIKESKPPTDKIKPFKPTFIYVFIDFYSSDDNAFEGFLWRNRMRMDKYKLAHHFDGKDRLIFYEKDDPEKIGSTQWISGSKVITIGANYMDMPQEIINDYLSKYPPAITFKASDFNPQALYKNITLQAVDTLQKSEDFRKSSGTIKGKKEEFKYMIQQCRTETWFRCQYGLTDKNGHADCPNTIIMNQDARKKGWDELKQIVLSRKLVMENVNKNDIENTNCPHDKQYDMEMRFLKALGLNEEDLLKDN
ncbi:MAG TPA: hypothetical protein VM658_15310 [bacterium]|nr:hypothetical protein [bacterium]